MIHLSSEIASLKFQEAFLQDCIKQARAQRKGTTWGKFEYGTITITGNGQMMTLVICFVDKPCQLNLFLPEPGDVAFFTAEEWQNSPYPLWQTQR
jgi:hypothetical protein